MKMALTITAPPSGPGDTIVRVKTTEVWGGGEVHQVPGCRGFDLGVTGKQGCSGAYTGQADLGGRGRERSESEGYIEASSDS